MIASRPRWRWSGEGGESGGVPLVRRGVDHGAARRAGQPYVEDAVALWRQARPVLWPRLMRPELAVHRPAIRRTRELFDRLRGGADFERELWRRVPDGAFRPAGTSVDLADPREIEKVHVDRHARLDRARDLYAKLSWVSVDEADASLRVRFSFGAERLDDWQRDPVRAVAADRLAEASFPESAALARHQVLLRRLALLAGVRVRLSERIVYSNAPGGGAAFHHDAEPGQLGVVYGQLAGSTAWLTLSARELAAALVGLVRRGRLGRELSTPARALAALRAPTPRLERLLDDDPRLTRRLVERGHLVVLRSGDVLVLPSHGPDAVAWHSVFGLGRRPSLAHSYGIFRRR